MTSSNELQALKHYLKALPNICFCKKVTRSIAFPQATGLVKKEALIDFNFLDLLFCSLTSGTVILNFYNTRMIG